MDIYVFMSISLQLSMLLWISIWISLDFYGYPCIDSLWILDPGLGLDLQYYLVNKREAIALKKMLNTHLR